ncbi:hypothetical protein DENIS_1820 [Desulfonema ishimotonii]|uniref:Uncharacterized protein n=1 Tax=Desulfonema ishimotonii TaxID=45657 RepID=A0A401FV74_9BACT|nr:hypothetical protein [Desulfonema ishimotonii]GBC60861.1 hypothetical protein DENIS_1820 [Desulfonema ishimotonii]
MKRNVLSVFLSVFISVFLWVAVGECNSDAYRGDYKIRSPLLFAKKDKKHKHHKKQDAYVYYYYPAAHIYFSPEKKDWFYRKGDKWKKAKHLPKHIRVHDAKHVVVRTGTDQPYLFFDAHKAKYAPHAARLKREFHYYPVYRVYSSPDQKSWFYQKDGKWKKHKKLPKHIRVQGAKYVVVRTETDQPYLFFDAHKVKYAPHVAKAKRKFHYYPVYRVYSSPDQKFWFYQKDGKWKKYKTRPHGIRPGKTDYVVLSAESDQPYVYFKKHNAKYGAGYGRRYTYYPSDRVYFDARDKVYFYPHKKGWKKDKKLPRHIRLKDAETVVLYLDEDRPYIYFEGR